MYNDYRKAGDTMTMIPRKEFAEIVGEMIFDTSIEIDRGTGVTMKQLGLKIFRSSGNRNKDRLIAVKRLGKELFSKGIEIHHRMDGLVGLIPTELHRGVPHVGFIKRLALS